MKSGRQKYRSTVITLSVDLNQKDIRQDFWTSGLQDFSILPSVFYFNIPFLIKLHCQLI